MKKIDALLADRRPSSLGALVNSSTSKTISLSDIRECLPTTGPESANPRDANCLVRFKGVNFHFGEKMVFNNLDFGIRSGECLVLLGPSGIGKSTLLRLLLKQN